MSAVDLDELDAIAEVELLDGLIGIPAARRFHLSRWGGPGSPYAMLRSQDVDDLEFVVVSPGVFFPDYAPEIDDELAAELDLASADDAVVLVILTVREPVETSTANLLGPIVLNRRTRQGAQVVLSPEDHDPRRPLFAPTEAAQR